MAQEDDSRKRAEQAEYRAKLIEAELNAIRSSQAYQVSKKIGIIKAQIRKDPIGLSKKAAKLILTNPKKARHMLRSVNRGANMQQSVSDQNAKYQEWILLNEPDEIELNEQRHTAEKLAYKPVISIITPVFNPPIDVLEGLIESVLEQTYPHFELCLGNFGDDIEVEALIAKYAKTDSRIQHYSFEKNLGIAGNSNQILEKSTGEFVALLDHDDTLSPDALYENVKLLNEKPYDFIYSDKDKIDDKGNRFDPLFKPRLSPEMLLNVNYLTHFNVMRTDIVRKIGGWDPETDGAQDWDLFLRVVGEAKHVGFIPKVLYHWRVIATSTAMSIETKPYALANQCKAIDKYLRHENLSAHAYVEKTELFLRWEKEALDASPLVCVLYSNAANTHRIMRRFRKASEDPQFLLLTKGTEADAKQVAAQISVPTLSYTEENMLQIVNQYLTASKSQASGNILFISDTVLLDGHTDWYEKLTGWLSIPEVAVAAGRLIDKKDLIVDSGGLVTAEGKYFPLFHKYPRYYQSYLGNAEWVRDLSVVVPVFCATKVSTLRQFLATKKQNYLDFEAYCLWIGMQQKRIVMSPHATAIASDETAIYALWPKRSLGKAPFADPFSNPNMAPNDPLRLFSNEDLQGVGSSATAAPLDAYQHDASILADTFDITQQEIQANSALLARKPTHAPHSAALFLPSFEAVYAGLMNIFSFANYLVEHDLTVTIYVLTGERSVAVEKAAVLKAFPAMQSAQFVAIRPDEINRIGKHDIGIATQWATAFPLAKVSTIAQKYYFIQDNEVNFYPKGSISALAELSYSFGFTAIAGTEGLLEMYRKTYGGDGVVLQSRIDLSAYRPREDKQYTPQKPYKVFFYARPGMPRNAFELGIAGLKLLKQQMGEEIEIVTAGALWDPEHYGVSGMFTNLGKVEYSAVPKLYREVDAGLMFMFSGHPGVTASELMASGCPVVVNEYDDKTWHELYIHEKTCLITSATASEIARNLQRCLLDTTLRKTLIEGGLKKAKTFYEGYDDSLAKAYNFIIGKK